ncbi:hypothetical protein CTheo_1401 [Ceratobasidium theobromae]|uniref:ABM domain-containing protein n=1 Tax=Ceratobasidium theobromae TaxID=1582974 RepID=A0A5N5QU85_9AGAM|nr:hypothetical protein CTheo_1401 [Ceratobasidium theobromae]
MTRPVTEFAILRLRSPVSLADPDLTAGLHRVSTQQSSWSGFPLHWFTYSKSENTFVCILSQWESVPAHQLSIDSPQNQALLDLLLPKLDIFAFCHVDLRPLAPNSQLGTVFQAQHITWRELDIDIPTHSPDEPKGDACGWAIDTPEPKFYVFRIANDAQIQSTHWTTMSRLTFGNP